MITMDEAKLHLRITDPDFDPEIGQMIEAAADHLASIGVDVTADPVPPAVKRAALLLIGHFFEHRGDEPAKADEPRAIAVDRLIAPHREIVL